MDLPHDKAQNPETDALAGLAARVSELEREVAALKLNVRGEASLSSQSVSISGQKAAAPVPPPPVRSFEPLPPALQRLVPGANEVPDRGANAAAPGPGAPRRSLEDRLGGQVFSRVGIVALLIAASWGLKLAFENQWIGPVGRVAIGLLAGAGLVLWSERFRRKGFPAFSFTLKAVATGVLYLTLWAGFRIYGLLPAPVALGLMIAVTAWNAFMAWSQNSELLAAYALSGAFATPLLLSTGGNHEIFLFTYIGSIDLATLLLLRLKPWPRLLLSALAGTVAFYFGWYLRFYDFLFVSGNSTPPFAVTTAFLLSFGVLFALGSVRGFLRWTEATAAGPEHVPSERVLGRSPAILSVLVPFGNAGFVALGLSLMVRQQFHVDLLPWLMAGLALLYLLLMRVQRTVTAAAMHLALAVIFLTVAIPLKASGHTLTIAWFAEGLTLFWVSTRIAAEEADAGAKLTPARILRALSLAGYLLGLGSLFVSNDVLNRGDHFAADLVSSLCGAAAFAAAAWLSLRPPGTANERFPRLGMVSVLGLEAVALILAAREFESRSGLVERAFFNRDFASALLALLLLGGTVYALAKLPREGHSKLFIRFAGVTFVLFNLLAILSVETEINALWHLSENNLQRSLAVSGFLMLYGALLLLLGFIRRSGFTRWQALLLILFTILKVFLYDMHSLSQGYRVLSFFGLGVLLLAVSFAYQKDWLGLKAAPSELKGEVDA